MKKFILILVLALTAGVVTAQKTTARITSIAFHLYTDSLKKGTHNYINVDGKLDNGRWMPLTEKEITLTASDCTFSGNELVIPADFSGEKITVKATLKANPALSAEKTIWIKTIPDPDKLPTKEEVIKDTRRKKQ